MRGAKHRHHQPQSGGAGASAVGVVPLLLDGAWMPRAEELPEDLRPLVERQAFELDFRRFDADVERLVAQLRRLLAMDPPPPVPEPEPAPEPSRSIPPLDAGRLDPVRLASLKRLVEEEARLEEEQREKERAADRRGVRRKPAPGR